MLQGQAPNPQVPGDLGKTISDAVKGSVNEALQAAADGMRGQRDALVAQRNELQAQLANASGSQRNGLRAQVKELDTKIDKLNLAIDKIDGKTGAYPGTTVPPLPNLPNLPSNPDYIPVQMIISVVAIIFIGFPLSIGIARMLWRRASSIGAPKNPTQMSVDQAQRFDRIEQAVDAVAIEIERISENQRYLTKVLAEGQEKKLTG